MAQTITEIALIPLLPGVNLDEGDAKVVWQRMLKTIASQKGWQKMYWGMKVEDKEVVVLVVGMFYLVIFLLILIMVLETGREDIRKV